MTREKQRTYRIEELTDQLREHSNMDLETLSDEELESLLFEEDSESQSSAFNLPTVAGLSLIVVGMVYIFQHLGLWTGFDLSALVALLPWLAGILIILIGLGVLSWRPRKKTKVRSTKARAKSGNRSKKVEKSTFTATERKRLTRSRDKKITGVCAGIADYFNVDPTLIRIAFVVGTLVSSGSFLIAYIILSMVMPIEDKEDEDRITIIRD